MQLTSRCEIGRATSVAYSLFAIGDLLRARSPAGCGVVAEYGGVAVRLSGFNYLRWCARDQ